MKVRYNSNNSGGNWWLKDGDWKNLEKAGWKIEWFKDNVSGCFKPDKKGRWLGALAAHAEKEFDSIRDALTEFEEITRQDVSDEGCTCCGPPHSFSWDDGCCSGENCLEYLYDRVPNSLRDACDRLN